MALMTWNEHFETGIPIVDEQHQWLIDLVNTSAPILAVRSKANLERAENLLDQLLQYASFHFETEDALMARYGIDGRHHRLHLDSHAKFAGEVLRMRDAYLNGHEVNGASLLSFLANWLIFHILGEDQALARQIRAINNGLTPMEAFERAEGDRRDPTHAALTRALIDVYTLMTEQNRRLMESNEELASHRSHLEELVQDRTADLVRALDAAQAANRARSSFIANLSHEIRTPMNAIVGLTWSLRQNTTDPAQCNRLDQVGEATKKLLAIINDLLDMARIESDRLQLEPLDFDPAQILREVIAGVTPAAAVKGLLLRVDAPNLPPMLRGDPVRLGQILGNFVSNAVKFTERGSVTLLGRLMDSRSGRPRLRFEVRDTGPGIADTDLATLFEPFEQVDTSTTRRHGGTGLGLAISKRLAEMMDGTVGVDSTQGVGSTFWVELPFESVRTIAGTRDSARVPPAAEGSATVEDLERQRETLTRLSALLADDDASAITLWHEMADSLRTAFDGRAAPFESALAAWDFAAAHALLQQTLAECGENPGYDALLVHRS